MESDRRGYYRREPKLHTNFSSKKLFEKSEIKTIYFKEVMKYFVVKIIPAGPALTVLRSFQAPL